jgi:CDP-diacylglycerol--glycerol-3-phosphate 3-phosphatidyltransferase
MEQVGKEADSRMKPRIMMTVPNLLTLIRLLAIPVLAYLIYAGESYQLLAFLLFLGIWLTDMLDGYIARRFNQITEFGKLFDPLVDKLFQLTTAVMMCAIGKLPVWVPLVMAGKELFMIVGSLVLLKRFDVVVHARWYGKLATVLFVLAFASLFILPREHIWLSHFIFIPPVFVSLFAYVCYGANFLRLRKKNQQRDLTGGNEF